MDRSLSAHEKIKLEIAGVGPDKPLTQAIGEVWTRYQPSGIQSLVIPLVRLASELEGRVAALEGYTKQLEMRVKELEDEADRF